MMKSLLNKLLLLSLLSIIIFSPYSCSIAYSDLASDTTALLALPLRAAVGGRWNISEDGPCNWAGVSCRANRVVELSLPGMGLSGHLPTALANLTKLQTLSLQFNALSAPLPAEFGNLASLRNLYLQGNLFSGEIPDFIFNLQNLVTLNLADNKFTGSISPDFNKLTRLATLQLEGNQLHGSIPELKMRSLHRFNVSFNKLTGPIPDSLSTKPANSFQGNSLCGKPLLLCDGTSNWSTNELSVGGFGGILIACAIGFLCGNERIKQRGVKSIDDPNQREEADTGEAEADPNIGYLALFKSSWAKGVILFSEIPRHPSVPNLERWLSDCQKLGEGTFGTTYKIPRNYSSYATRIEMVVKRLNDVKVSHKKFRETIEAVGNINHENLVSMVAACYILDVKLIVYECIAMGSLSDALHGKRRAKRTRLNWETRSRIALGAARAMAHLHAQCPPLSHGNIKSSNILLTTTSEARVSDYGLAHVAGPTLAANQVDGYRAPEVTDTLKVSQKADVYSFGVVLLELLTGKASIVQDEFTSEEVDLPRWILSVVENELTSELFDFELLRYENVEECLAQFLQVAISCISQNPDNRPSMDEVSTQIEKLCHSTSSRNTS